MMIKKLALAAVIGASMLSPVAYAAGTASFDQVMTSVKASKMGAEKIQGLTAVKSVNVVKISDIAQGQDMSQFDAAVTQNTADITALQTALTAKPEISKALTDANVQPTQVVAADVAMDGIVTVYVR